MASSGAAAIAAAAGRARRDVSDYFDAAGAVDVVHAVSYRPPTRLHEQQLQLLVGEGILKETRSGRYWIDVSALEAEVEQRKRSLHLLSVVIMMGVLFVVLGILIAVH